MPLADRVLIWSMPFSLLTSRLLYIKKNLDWCETQPKEIKTGKFRLKIPYAIYLTPRSTATAPQKHTSVRLTTYRGQKELPLDRSKIQSNIELHANWTH